MNKEYIDIVFDGPPSHESGRFVEVENSEGRSINFGEWVQRPDGFWALRLHGINAATARRTERTFTEEESKNIKRLAFNYDRNTVDVLFRDDDDYRYLDVPSALLAEFSNSDKPGAFLAQRIKGHYRFYHLNGD